MWMLWLTSFAQAADCDLAALTAALQASEAAMETLDAGALTFQASEAKEAANCATEPVGPDLAARLYRSVGVLEYVAARRPEEATKWFRATKRAAPNLTLPASMAGPVQQAFDAVDVSGDEARTAVAMPRTWTLRVDGAGATSLPGDRPYLMQWVGPEGVQSRLVAGRPPLSPPPDPEVVAPPPPERKPTAWFVASGVTAGLAVACLGGSLAQNGAMKRATDTDSLDRAYGRQRTFAVGFWGLAAGSVGLGVAGALR